MKVFTIDIQIDAPQAKVWEVLTDFARYPEWNSILRMQNNPALTVGEKFQVTILGPGKKQSKFRAALIAKQPPTAFVATQVILARWFFLATHHFRVEPLPSGRVRFVQTWELKGIVSALFKKAIFKELGRFRTMNEELKTEVEQGS